MLPDQNNQRSASLTADQFDAVNSKATVQGIRSDLLVSSLLLTAPLVLFVLFFWLQSRGLYDVANVFSYKGTRYSPILSIPILAFCSLLPLLYLIKVLINRPFYIFNDGHDIYILDKKCIALKDVDVSSMYRNNNHIGQAEIASLEGRMIKIPSIICEMSAQQIEASVVHWALEYKDSRNPG